MTKFEAIYSDGPSFVNPGLSERIVPTPQNNTNIILVLSYLARGAMETTRLSEKGQIVIPKRIRTGHKWEPGLEFSVEDLCDSIALKPIRAFKRTKLRDVLGCAQYRGARKSLKDMEDAISKGAKERP